MNNYIDVVLVEPLEDTEERIICQAPAFSHLKAGETVVINGTDIFEESVAQVISSHTFSENSEELDFLCASCGVSELPRLKSKIVYRFFDYEGVDDE